MSGRTLARPYAFTFTTPTVRLLAVNWYRLGGRFDQPAILALRFNQAVRPADALAHVTARYQVHTWQRPRSITVGVWVGNFDRHPLIGSSGVSGAGPIFHAIMLAAAHRAGDDVSAAPTATVAAPGRAARQPICALSGMPASHSR